MDNNFLTNLIPPTISLLITSFIALFIGVLIEKYKNRYIKLYYTVTSQKITSQISNVLGTNLKILIDNRETNLVKVFSVVVENNASVDIVNLTLRFFLNAPAKFQGNEAYLLDSYQTLYWSKPFNDELNNILEEFDKTPKNEQTGLKDLSDELQNRIDIFNINREYSIPIFNRKQKAYFNFLIEDPHDNFQSHILAAVYHKSVKLIKKNNDEKEKQKDIWKGVVLGIVVVFIAVLIYVLEYPEHRTFIILSSLIGFSYSIVGFLLLAMFRKFRDFIK